MSSSYQPADAARETLAELRLLRNKLTSQIIVPEGTVTQERADYWLGRLEGTIESLLSVIAAQEKESS